MTTLSASLHDVQLLPQVLARGGGGQRAGGRAPALAGVGVGVSSEPALPPQPGRPNLRPAGIPREFLALGVLREVDRLPSGSGLAFAERDRVDGGPVHAHFGPGPAHF